MYTLLSGLYKYMFRRDEYCILILGLDNAGKTTFLEQTKIRFNRNYKGMSLSKITTTVGLNIGTIDVGKARLMFWDLGGQDELQSLWDKYYAESHGIIYVIDSTDEERLSESKRAFEKVVISEALEGVPILVLANKQDVEISLQLHQMHKQPSVWGPIDKHLTLLRCGLSQMQPLYKSMVCAHLEYSGHPIPPKNIGIEKGTEMGS
ncbi:ADP-ribosylation factor-related protein 1 isoform X2 [Pelodiscus sinensis]|uniref:ADP-ribosylation factor-related protein 1 isoform X2 n=1 Tax=Pelodiscus sinensis TaxID=13735 RepID=UPI003F6B981D